VLRAIARGERALFRVLEELGPALAVIDLNDAEAELVSDWDEPADIRR
jgi:hypothetical protein